MSLTSIKNQEVTKVLPPEILNIVCEYISTEIKDLAKGTVHRNDIPELIQHGYYKDLFSLYYHKRLYQTAFMCAVMSGNITEVKKAARVIYKRNQDDTIVLINPIKTLKWLQANKFKISTDNYNTAAKFGNFNVLNWLHENKVQKKSINYLDTDDIKVYEWFADHKFKFETDEVIRNAADSNYLNVVQWFATRGYRLNEEIYADFALNNNMTAIKWLHEQKIRPEYDAINYVMKMSNDDFEWFLRNVDALWKTPGRGDNDKMWADILTRFGPDKLDLFESVWKWCQFDHEIYKELGARKLNLVTLQWILTKIMAKHH